MGSKQYSSPPEMSIDPNLTYSATIKTAGGDIVLRLYADKAPNTVNNFVFLARDGFYDGVIFHRVIENFMAPDRRQRPRAASDPAARYRGRAEPSQRHDQRRGGRL